MDGGAKPTLLKFLRIGGWLHILGLPLIGALYASRMSLFSLDAPLAVLVGALYLAHGYSQNNYFDWQQEGIFIGSKKKYLALSYAFFLLNCALALSFSRSVFFLVLAGSLTGWAYSGWPLRLKRFILPNLALNSFGFSLLFLIGFVAVHKGFTSASLSAAALFFFIFIPLQIVHQISHAQEDTRDRLPTLYTRYGPRCTALLVNLSFVIIALCSLVVPLARYKQLLFFLATVAISLVFSYALRGFICSGISETGAAVRLRMYVRKAYILYGIVIGVIFYL